MREVVSAQSRHEYNVRAKYYTTLDGELKLARVQLLGLSSFHDPDWDSLNSIKKRYEDIVYSSSYQPQDLDDAEDTADVADPKHETDAARAAWNLRRSLNRAKIRAFDKILCNPDLDAFVTFTFDPAKVGDYTSWDDVYGKFSTWLKNMVQRYDLKYVCCPERYRTSEGLHMHAIVNRSALGDLPRSRSARTGRLLYTEYGAPKYDVPRFRLGFATCVLIQSTTLDREKVAKYIFKYMGKQGINGRIGGRFVLSGGKFNEPIYLYGSDPREFLPDNYLEDKNIYHRKTEFVGMTYEDWSFI